MEHSLADGVFDPLPLGSQPLSFLPAHLHQHLVSDVLHRQLELLVLGIIRLPALLRGKNREKGSLDSMENRRTGKRSSTSRPNWDLGKELPGIPGIPGLRREWSSKNSSGLPGCSLDPAPDLEGAGVVALAFALPCNQPEENSQVFPAWCPLIPKRNPGGGLSGIPEKSQILEFQSGKRPLSPSSPMGRDTSMIPARSKLSSDTSRDGSFGNFTPFPPRAGIFPQIFPHFCAKSGNLIPFFLQERLAIQRNFVG